MTTDYPTDHAPGRRIQSEEPEKYAGRDTSLRKNMHAWHHTFSSDWQQPARWQAAARRTGERQRVLVQEWHTLPVDRLLDQITATPDLDWMLCMCSEQLAEWRPALERSSSSAASAWLHGDAPANAWIGTQIRDQADAAARMPALLGIPARLLFVICRPRAMIDLTRVADPNPPLLSHGLTFNALSTKEGGATFVAQQSFPSRLPRTASPAPNS